MILIVTLIEFVTIASPDDNDNVTSHALRRRRYCVVQHVLQCTLSSPLLPLAFEFWRYDTTTMEMLCHARCAGVVVALRPQNLAAVARCVGMVSGSVLEHPASDSPLDRQSPLATLGHI